MRIAIFSETFLPKVDGVVNTVCRLLEHLELRGHTSMLFAPIGGPPVYASTPIIEFAGYPFPRYPELRLVPPIVKVDQQLENLRPDIIHLVNPVSLGLIGLQYGRKMNIPVVASYHTDVPGFAARWGLGYLNPVIWAFFRSVHNTCDLNLAPSHFTADQIRDRGFQKIKIWGRGVNTDLFSPTKRSEKWRNHLSQGNPSAPLLLYVGRLAIEKRVEWLLNVVRTFPTARLAIVGDGPLRPKLERIFTGTNTILTGYMKGEELAQVYASADIFVFPGANETFGNVVLEASASGLPVVAPNSGGAAELVEDGISGWLFDSESNDSLVERVSRFIQRPEMIRIMGKSGRVLAESHNWTSIMDGLLYEYWLQIQAKLNLETEQLRVNPAYN